MGTKIKSNDLWILKKRGDSEELQLLSIKRKHSQSFHGTHLSESHCRLTQGIPVMGIFSPLCCLKQWHACAVVRDLLHVAMSLFLASHPGAQWKGRVSSPGRAACRGQLPTVPVSPQSCTPELPEDPRGPWAPHEGCRRRGPNMGHGSGPRPSAQPEVPRCRAGRRERLGDGARGCNPLCRVA